MTKTELMWLDRIDKLTALGKSEDDARKEVARQIAVERLARKIGRLVHKREKLESLTVAQA